MTDGLSMPDRRRPAEGQVLVIFAVAMVALLASAGLAFDVGRFYSEKRYLQNAADAAALAAANALIRGETPAEAETRARDNLTRNMLHSPAGSNAQVPPATPQYLTGHAGDPLFLTNGILIGGGEVRVAIQSDVGYTFGRAIGLSDNRILGQARVRTAGDLLPIAVRHFINAPGDNTGVPVCDGSENVFQDLISTQDTACLGTETNGALRLAPSPDAEPHNPARHGPIIALVGQGAAPSNNASFRGFVTLDVRNFASASSNVFYNGVTAGTNANTLKAMEAAWIGPGYPGPAFPPATIPPDPNDQVGIMDGNSAGVVVDAIGQRYKIGDEILAAVYSGTTMTIPDFAYTVASAVTINNTENRDNAITMTSSKNASFAGVVYTSTVADWGDPASPLANGTLAPLAFTPEPNTPPATVRWTSFDTTGAPDGISTFWIKGHSPSPYLVDHYYPIALNVGGVNRDFTSNGNGTVFAMAATGGTATGTITFSTPNNGGTFFGGTVNVSLEGGVGDLGVLPAGIGSISLTPASFVLNKGQSQAVNVAIGGGSLGPGEYPLTLRATGVNQAGEPVTHLIPIQLDIATASTSSEYVDILGFAVFRIADVNANDVMGYAISRSYADMNDPELARGQVARLVPWG